MKVGKHQDRNSGIHTGVHTIHFIYDRPCDTASVDCRIKDNQLY